MKTVLFVHGFGVMKDARGLFTDISGFLAKNGINSLLTDLNTKDSAGDIILSPPSEQVRILTSVFKSIGHEDVDLVCHSQGCVVAALANLDGIQTTYFLAPPTDTQTTRTIEYFKKDPRTTVDIDGVSRLARRDGTFTIVPSAYWKERESLDIRSLYTSYLSTHKTVVVQATKDEVVSNEMLDKSFPGQVITRIDADHNFNGDAREALLKELSKRFQTSPTL